MGLANWRDWRIPDTQTGWTSRDTLLYALGLGCGLADDDLPFIYEPGLRTLPTMALVLGAPGFWLMQPQYGLDWPAVLHGEQSLTLHRPVPQAGQVTGRTRVERVADRGAGRGAIMQVSRDLATEDGSMLATLSETWVLRGDGGAGGRGDTRPLSRRQAAPPPDRAPDATLDLPTSRQTALIYRLTGDLNPLHVDPAIAALAGFPRPILHGLATFGIAGRALIALAAGNDPDRLRAMKLRFTAPVFPGETIRTELWRDGGLVRFRAWCVERNLLVLDHGEALIA